MATKPVECPTTPSRLSPNWCLHCEYLTKALKKEIKEGKIDSPPANRAAWW